MRLSKYSTQRITGLNKGLLPYRSTGRMFLTEATVAILTHKVFILRMSKSDLTLRPGMPSSLASSFLPVFLIVDFNLFQSIHPASTC